MTDPEKPGKPEAAVTADDFKEPSKASTVKDDGTVEVDIGSVESPNDKVEKPTEKPAEPTQPSYVTHDELKSIQNAMAYQTRLVEKALKGGTPQASTTEPAPKGREPNEIDKAAERDWQEGVRLVIRDEYKQISEQQRIENEKAQKVQSDQAVMQVNQRYVADTYPDLSDDKSSTTKIYLEACNELAGVDANFYGNPYGPIAAMRKMEEKMRIQGIPLPGVKEQADTEVARRARTGAASMTPAKPAGSKGKYTLNAEQKAFCDQNNIPYDQYAVNASKLDRGESLEA